MKYLPEYKGEAKYKYF
jgi:hypothetical protein